MLLSQLTFVGYGVGSESFDSVYNDTARERWTSPPGAVSYTHLTLPTTPYV